MRSADLIRIARRRARLTQAELDKRIGRPRANVTRWESGAVKPSFERLQEIVRGCGIDYTVNQMSLSKELLRNIKQGYYEGGHMIYLNKPAMQQ